MIAGGVRPGRRNERDELLEQLQGLEDHVRGAVAPATPQAIEELSIGKSGETLGRQWRTRHVTAQSLEAFAIPCRDRDVGVQAQAAPRRTTGTRERGQILNVDAVPEPLHALACAGTGGEAAAHRRIIQRSQQGRLGGERVGFRGLRLEEAVPEKKPLEASREPLEHACHLAVCWGRQR
jgi:hypothetical protein